MKRRTILRAPGSERRAEIGDRIVFTLINTARFSSARTGNRPKCSIDRLVEEGWRSVFVVIGSGP